MNPKTKQNPKGAGRNSKQTVEVEAKLTEALRDGCTRRAACAYAGISEQTLANWSADSFDFLHSLTRAENPAEAGFTRALANAAREGDWRAAESWLKRRRKDDWSEKTETQHSGTIGVEVNASDLPDDQLASIAVSGGGGTP